jgi:CDP-paratose 2-epimerase
MGSYELMDHNLIGTIRVLELCKSTGAGLILLSTSRVYSVQRLSALNVEVEGKAFRLRLGLRLRKEEGGKRPSFAPSTARGGASEGLVERGLSTKGISEEFSTEPPLSLYGASKRCAELLAMEYGDAFGFPVWINRCGVLAGKGQFGKADQGIFSFWIRSWMENRPLKYIGFDGKGSQVRDCLHPKDLLPVLKKQMGGSVNVKVNVKEDGKAKKSERVDLRICNFGGGLENSCSLAQLSGWCEKRFGARKAESDPKPRPYDLPWVVLDSSRAKKMWGWEVKTSLEKIFEEIAGS